jgi:hypothetical protein
MRRKLYARESGILRYMLICDDCGEEMQEVLAGEYAPHPVFDEDL